MVQTRKQSADPAPWLAAKILPRVHRHVRFLVVDYAPPEVAARTDRCLASGRPGVYLACLHKFCATSPHKLRISLAKQACVLISRDVFTNWSTD